MPLDCLASFPLRVGIAATFTAEPLSRYESHLKEQFDAAVRFSYFPMGHIGRFCADPVSLEAASGLDALVLLWRLEDLFENVYRECAVDADLEQQIPTLVQQLCEQVLALRTSFRRTVVFSLPPVSYGLGAHSLGFTDIEKWLSIHSAVVGQIMRNSDLRREVRLLDLGAVVNELGTTAALDDRKWYIYHQPYKEAFYKLLAVQIARLLILEVRLACKCLVVDADNTLWGGVVGEDGIAGIHLGGGAQGEAFRDFQKELLALKRRGILLAMSSKNNADDVLEVLNAHDGMALRPEDFSVLRINWDKKSDNIRAIASELHIGTESVVFIDDSDVELAEVASSLPEVRCLKVPADVVYLPRMLRQCGLFEQPRRTEEDLMRAASLSHDRQRSVLKAQMGHAEYLESLKTSISVFPPQDMHLERITQLINKTNQFNLTTVRRTFSEVESLASSEEHLILCAKVSDCFSDYGLCGVAILRKVCRLQGEVDTLLLSCRVLNRGVETAFFSTVAQYAADLGLSSLLCTWSPTAKNQLARDFYPSFSSTVRELSSGRYLLDLTQPLPAGPHVRVDRKGVSLLADSSLVPDM